MAKEEEKQGDYEFIPPDFDEDAFVHKEVTAFRTTTILFCWGILVAILTFAVFRLAFSDGLTQSAWLIGLAIAAVAGFALKFLFPALKADVSHFGRKEWFGTAALFFFTWLSFVVLLINPPLSDFSEPRVDGYALPEVQEAGGPVRLELFAADNHRVEDVEFQLRRGESVVAGTDALHRADGRWTYDVPAGEPAATYTWTFSATDPKGHVATDSGSFRVTTGALTFAGDNVTLDPTNRVVVQFGSSVDKLPPCTKKLLRTDAACVRVVTLEHVDGSGAITMVPEPDKGIWVADVTHAGWKQGENRVRVKAVLADRFDGSERIEGAEIVKEGPFTVNVPSGGGAYEPKVLPDPKQPQRNVPGLGLVALLGGLVAAVAVVRRRAE